MTGTFLNKFSITTQNATKEDNTFFKALPIELFELLDKLGGNTFNNGLYRIHTLNSSIKWAILLGEYFKGYTNKIYPFGFDWLGRQFCLSATNNILFMFDPGTMEDYKFEQTVVLFHNNDLVNDTNNILSIDLFEDFLNLNKITAIDYNECAGFNKLLFLGGNDNLENYQVQDLEVYWHFSNQVYQQIKDLPEGTKIGNIKLK